MKRKLLMSLILVLILFLSSCSKSELADLQFFVIEQTKISDSLTDKELVLTAKNDGRLAFDGNDISGYNWQEHIITLKESSITSLGSTTKETGGSSIFKVDDTYVFVVILKNNLVYYGGFSQGTKNPSVPLQPFIADVDKHSFRILFNNKYDENSDVRINKSLYSFLNNFGLLSSKK